MLCQIQYFDSDPLSGKCLFLRENRSIVAGKKKSISRIFRLSVGHIQFEQDTRNVCESRSGVMRIVCNVMYEKVGIRPSNIEAGSSSKK